MVTFTSARDIAAMVAAIGAEAFWRRLSAYLVEDFLRWDAFDKTPRYAAHSAEGVIELMPTSDGAAFAFKYVNGHPGNSARGLQTVVAFGALADVATGHPLLLSDMTLPTAFRTAAASALAARALARPESRTMALIGLGAQAEFQADAFDVLLGVDHLRVFDLDEAATEKFLRNMDARNLVISRCRDAREAARGADIVTTITADKRRAAILDAGMIAPGTHINAVGGDCPGKTELSAALLRGAEIFVEYAPQTRVEGDIQQLPPDHPVTELRDVLAGLHAGRGGPASITIFDSVGFAVEDFSILRLLRDLSRETRIGATLDLTAAPDDPRDLYALLRPGADPRRAAA